ncbi:MAG: hypothetical protein IAE89_01565 [Anaerolineae bacterium]|nr:hypothetical protein [Anaerolineae bacterium]
MPQRSIFRWKEGRGWLVIASGASTEIRGMALNRLAADGAIACVAPGQDSSFADVILDDFADLGAPSGYVVDLQSEDDDTLLNRLGEASLIVINGHTLPSEARSELMGAAMDGIAQAYENGAIILAEGDAGIVFGLQLYDSDEITGFNWIENTIILPGIEIEGVEAFANHALVEYPDRLAIMIGDQSAMAFGGDGQIETWGLQQVTLRMGPAFGQNSEG